MKKQTIVIDIDGTKIDTLPVINNFYNQANNTNLKLSDYKDYDLGEVWGISNERVNEIIEDLYHSRFLLQAAPMPFAQEAIARLAAKYNLVSATARPDYIQNQTQFQLDRFFPGHIQQIIYIGHYKLSEESHSKLGACLQVDASIIIDDHLETILECAENGIRGILFGKQYDLGENGQINWEEIERARDWREVLELLK